MCDVAVAVSVPQRSGGADVDSAAILNALPAPVLVVDERDGIVSINPAAEQFFQGSAAVLLGVNLQDLIPHDSPLLALTQRIRRRGYSMSEYGVRIATPRIGQHFVTIDAGPLGDAPGHVVLVLQERTIAGRIDSSLIHRGAARSVTAMAAMLAHEVKNPLCGVGGAAQLLEESIRPEDRRLTGLIVDEADRICALVARMEVFSSEPLLDRAPVNIHEKTGKATG